MRLLRLSSGPDEVDLRRHLVARAEPRLADRRNRGVGEIEGEDLRVGLAKLLQRVPDPVIRAGGGEMVGLLAGLRPSRAR